MGSSSSKVAKGAARKYPSRAPGAAVPQAVARQPRAEAPKPKSKTLGNSAKDDAATPLGPSAPPGPSFAPSRSNPTLVALSARDRLQDEAEEDFANMGREGRRFLDMRTLVDAMKFRDRGIPEKEIESRLRIQPGLLSKLGQEKTFSHVTSPN
ncbi:hypothetical protein FoTM2_001348 [Fusarium oxysporum f. sp. vasinfectum]|nr:hypothetical protein FoTM2_001348 [Fusarium oxysporum f. sp. vasinfectum]WKT38705.1 hypothetical protein QSH57_000523 [Fusarium oxysporum f. sp. vasinfectum]